MNLSLTMLTYGAIFIAGPMIYVVMTRLPARRLTLVLTAIAVAVAVLVAFVLLPTQPFVSLTSLWLAWVLAITLMIMAVQARGHPTGTSRWTFIFGLLATTMPWFGLAAARTVAH